jgi:hypothetical protein
MSNPINRSAVFIYPVIAKPGILTGAEGDWKITDRSTNSIVSLRQGKAAFHGNLCTSLLSKIAAFIGAFFGFGCILTICIPKDLTLDGTRNQERTFWVSLKVTDYLESFGNHDGPDHSIRIARESPFEITLRIRKGSGEQPTVPTSVSFPASTPRVQPQTCAEWEARFNNLGPARTRPSPQAPVYDGL